MHRYVCFRAVDADAAQFNVYRISSPPLDGIGKAWEWKISGTQKQNPWSGGPLDHLVHGVVNPCIGSKVPQGMSGVRPQRRVEFI